MDKLLASLSLLVGLITALLALLVAFGVNITPDQHTAIMAVVGAGLALVGAWFHPDLPPNKQDPAPVPVPPAPAPPPVIPSG